ncbi:nuclear pore complex protein Nup214-like [Saccostrea echinata]|uniref:nuclear pore complex protein Nup214-like n=1 Tax=Saccostrea echinata TaxID=191078 RepID=UPI002A8090DE|nr:nuclear pore complex protein Nup214-like [Saccostrea echinata]
MASNEDPPEREVKDFRFQQLCRIRIFDQPGNPIQGVTQLVASSSLYGLTFLGTTNGFKVIKTSDLTDIDNRHASERTTLVVPDPPFRASIPVEGTVSHLCLSCDELTLAVVVSLDSVVQIYMYDVRGVANQGQEAEPFQKIRMRNSVLDLAWNPTQPTLIVVCMSDGTAQLLEVTENLKIVASLPPVVAARSVCWSPKGKQLVIGTGNGTLMQFDHELKKKRDWDRPSVLPEDQQFEVKGVAWVSTYMFLASYFSSDGSDNQPTVILTSGSKDGAPAFINFEDPCYGNGEGMACKMHFNYISQWEMVLCTSSTACETAIVAKHFDNKNTFERWTLDDAARAELPLTEDYADTFPLGAAVDLSSQYAIPVGERSHPPSPLFMLLSTDGVLVTYYMMYSHAEAPVITQPPQPLPAGPVRKPQPSNTQGTIQKDTAPIEARPQSQSGQTVASPAVSQGQSSDSKASAFGFSASGSVGKSLFGAPATQGFSFTSSTSSSSAGAGSIFGQNASATTQVGQSFLASALTAPVTTAAAATIKTGFAASSAAPSQFSFKPQPSANFSFNATVTTPSAPVSTKFGGTTTAISSSFAPQSTSANNTGFNFSFSSSSTSSSGPDKTPVVSAAPISSKPMATPTPATQSQVVFGTPTSSKPSTFTFGVSASSAAAFGVKPTAASTLPTFGVSAPPTVSTQQGFGSVATSTLPKFGLTAVATQAGVTPASPAVKPNLIAGTSGSAVPSFGSTSVSSVPTFGAKSTLAGVMPSFGNLRSASNTPSSQQSQAKPGAGIASTQGPTASLQGLLAEEKKTSMSIPKPSPAPTAERQEPSESKPVTGLVTQNIAVTDSSQKTLTSNATSDSLNDTFSASIAEEIAHFERELREFKQRAGAVRETIGSKADMQRLRNSTIEVSNFCGEVKANTKEQSKEISDLKGLCLDCFAMVEDCKMREQLNTDPQYGLMMRNRALDPKSLSTMRDLQQQQQLLDQGLRDVDAILDQEWQDYQSRKKKKQGIKRPTTDGIYQVIKSNRNLIIREKNQLCDLESQLKQLKLYNKNSTWKHPDSSRGPAELSSLADSLLESPPKSPGNNKNTPRNYSLIPHKQAKLREYLSRKTVAKVKSTRPENLSMSRLASTEKIRQALSRQSSPTKAPPPAEVRTELKPSIQGRTILRATSHNGARQLASQGLHPLSPGKETGIKHQLNTQVKPNSYQQGLMFSNIGKTSSPMISFQPKVPQNLKPSDSYPQFEDITPTTSSDVTEEEEDDDDDYEEEDDYDEEQDPDSEHDSEPLNRKIAERKPATGLPTAFSVKTTKPALLPTHGFGQGLSGFTSFSGGSQTAPVFGGGFQGLKTDNKTPTNTSTPKTAFKFGGDASSGFGGKNLFGQPPKTEENKMEESKPISSPLLAKALSTESDEEEVDFGRSDVTKDQTNTDNKGPEKPETESKSATAEAESTTGKTAMSGLFGFGKSPSSQSLTDKSASKGVFGQSTSTGSSLFGQPTGNTASVTDASDKATPTAGKPYELTNLVTGGSLFAQPFAHSGGLLDKSTKEEETEKSAPATTAATGLFGQSTTSSDGTGLFGKANSSQASATSAGGVFGQLTTSNATTSEATPTGQDSKMPASTSAAGGIFKGEAVTTVSSNSGSGLFEQKPTTSGTGLFGQSSSTVSSAGQGLFGQQTTATSGMFGQTTVAPPSYSSSESGLFGRPLTSGSGAFEQTSTATSFTGTGLFGQQTSTSGSGLFGQQTTTSGSGLGLFGQKTTTSGSGSGLFGQQTTTQGSEAGLFGQQTTTSGSGGGLFGQQTTTSGSGAGLFGQQTTTSGSGGGLFGQQTTSVSGSFGQPSTSTSTSGSGLFGQSVTISTSGGGLFGTAGATTASTTGTGLFGQVSSTSITSSSGTGLFGQSGSGGFGQSSTGPKPSMLGGLLSGTEDSPATGSTFGQGSPAKNLFGTPTGTSSSAFGQPAPLFGTSTAGTGFGNTSSSGGFGTSGGGLGFGGTATTTSVSGFGQTNPGVFGQSTGSTSSPFGGGFGSAPSGQSSGGLFGGGGSGGMFSGLGGKPSEDKAKTNVFGSAQSFGSSATPQTNLFGSQGPSTFRSGGGSSPFAGGGFSGGGSNVASSGFGVAKTQSPGGFGGSPSFGGSPAFGGQASFGSSPGFGSAPTFGGGSTFGSGASFSNQLGSPQNTGSAGGFAGFASGSSPTFGGLAHSGDTTSFGALSQASSGFGGFGGGGGGFGSSSGFGQSPSSSGNPSFTGYRS